MNKFLVLISVVFYILNSFHVHAQGNYWVAFTDKNNTAYTLSTPEEFLSARAIERRTKQNIPIDSLDLPVNLHYIDSVLSLDAKFVHASKWLNGITVFTESPDFATEVLNYSFVREIQRTKPLNTTKSSFDKFKVSASNEKDPIDTTYYGPSVYQTGLMNGQFLHNQGFNGEGMQIAVLDGGFLNTDTYSAFDSLWANGQILGTKDFVDPKVDFYKTHYHGMSVLSCMGGNIPGSLIGTARKAAYWLIRSEDTGSEYIIEEDNWVSAAEFADSVGVDVINSSLGYYKFDDSLTDHTYADMDGKTTRVTRGANIAASRGMLVFSSAGNEGQKSWKYIIAPSDGDAVSGIGATNKFGFAAYFTSYGPASDGDIKPNVAGVGYNTYLQKSNGTLGYASGTSFSSPVMAGMAACLWQAASNATATEVKKAMELSAGQYENPDSLLGYGVPDFELAWIYLVNQSTPDELVENEWFIYPNPVKNRLVIQKNGGLASSDIELKIYTLGGRLVRQWKKPDSPTIVLSHIGDLPSGILLLKITSENRIQTVKLNKIH